MIGKSASYRFLLWVCSALILASCCSYNPRHDLFLVDDTTPQYRVSTFGKNPEIYERIMLGNVLMRVATTESTTGRGMGPPYGLLIGFKDLDDSIGRNVEVEILSFAVQNVKGERLDLEVFKLSDEPIESTIDLNLPSVIEFQSEVFLKTEKFIELDFLSGDALIIRMTVRLRGQQKHETKDMEYKFNLESVKTRFDCIAV